LTSENPNHSAQESDVHFIGLTLFYHNIYLQNCYAKVLWY